MRKRMFTTLTAVLAGAGMSVAQGPGAGATRTANAQTAPGGSASYAPSYQLDRPAGAAVGTPSYATGATPGQVVSSGPGGPVMGGQVVNGGAPVATGQIDGLGSGPGFGPGEILAETGHPASGRFNDGPCANPYIFYVDAEYLLWALKDLTLPASTIQIPSTQLPTGQPTANSTTAGSFASTTAFSNTSFSTPWMSGFRAHVGSWFDDQQSVGVEGTFFLLGRAGSSLNANANAEANFNFPYTQLSVSSITPGTPPTTTLTPATGIFPGQIKVAALADSSSMAQGAEVNVYYRVSSTFADRLHLLTGFRWVELNETLDQNEVFDASRASSPVLTSTSAIPITPTQGALSTGNAIPMVSATFNDSVRTNNSFYGWQVGTKFDAWCGRAFIEGFGKVGVGLMHQSVTAFGNTTVTTFSTTSTVNPTTGAASISPNPATPTTTSSAGGLLANPLSQGTFSRDVLAFVPEVSIKTGYQFSQNIRAYLGYNFMYMSSVVRPGSQFGQTATNGQLNFFNNTTSFTNTQSTVTMRGTDTYLHGLFAGLQIRY